MKEGGFKKKEPAREKAWCQDHSQNQKEASVAGEEWEKRRVLKRQDPGGNRGGMVAGN